MRGWGGFMKGRGSKNFFGGNIYPCLFVFGGDGFVHEGSITEDAVVHGVGPAVHLVLI